MKISHFSQFSLKRILFVFICFLLIALPSNAEEERWFDGFFFDLSGLYYFAPDLLSEFIKTEIGFRGAAGYEFKGFRFGIESGFSRIDGTNPLVKEILLTPLVFKFGYAFPLFLIFGLQADIGVGAVFSKTNRYETAVDIVLENLSEDNEISFFSGARLYATISPLNFLKFYAGGGVDLIIETDGLIPLPAVEIGVSFKILPFKKTKQCVCCPCCRCPCRENKKYEKH